nr:hypothetical protein BaRGS_022299 [Batillaria attramentaria]
MIMPPVMGHLCALVCVLLILLLALAATLVALLTDNWYRVDTDDIINPSNYTKQRYNFHYGLWRLCYDDVPAGE